MYAPFPRMAKSAATAAESALALVEQAMNIGRGRAHLVRVLRWRQRVHTLGARGANFGPPPAAQKYFLAWMMCQRRAMRDAKESHLVVRDVSCVRRTSRLLSRTRLHSSNGGGR